MNALKVFEDNVNGNFLKKLKIESLFESFFQKKTDLIACTVYVAFSKSAIENEIF